MTDNEHIDTLNKNSYILNTDEHVIDSVIYVYSDIHWSLRLVAE